MSQDPTRCLKRFIWAVITAIVMCSCSGETDAEESGDILWSSKPRGSDTMFVQLHRGGYAWVRLDARTRRKAMSQAALSIAFRTDPRVYDRLRQRFLSTGLTGGIAECSPQHRVGIYPTPGLFAPAVVCARSPGLIDELEHALFPALETLSSSWERLIEVTHTALHGAVLETAELEITLTRAPGHRLVESAGKRNALVSDQLVQTLKGPWGVEPVLVRYTASVRVGRRTRVDLTFPKNTALFVNGTDAAKSPLFTRVDASDAQFVTAWRDLPRSWYRFHRGTRNAAHAWVYHPSSLSFPTQLWEDSPDIAIDYKRGAEFVTRARFEPASKRLQLCTPDGTCSSLDAADARGLAVQAYAECDAALAARQSGSSDEKADPVSLFVRIAEHTCDLSFDHYCLPRQQPGLDRVIQMLTSRSVEPNQIGERRSHYPLCVGSSQ